MTIESCPPSPVAREIWVDYVRIMATIGVIIIHVVAHPLASFGIIDTWQWWLSLILRHLTTIAVPLFFMISGYLYLGKPLTLHSFFLKRLRVIIIPMMIWSWIWIFSHHGFDWRAIGWKEILQPLHQPAMYHLWFLYPLLGLYVALPFIALIVKEMPMSYHRYWWGIWLTIGVIDILQRLGMGSIAIKPEIISTWVGYFVAGHLLARYNPIFKMWHVMICAVVVAGGMIAMTAHYTSATMPNPTLFYESSTVQVMLLSCCVFLCCVHYKTRFRESKLIYLLADRSYCVYLVHPFLLLWAERELFHLPEATASLPIYYIPAMIIFTLIGSFLIAFMVRILKLQLYLG